MPRFGRRRRRYFKKRTPPVKKVVQKVLRSLVPPPEMKQFTGAASATVLTANTAIHTLCNAMGQGDTSVTREGNHIRVHRWEIRGYVSRVAAQTATDSLSLVRINPYIYRNSNGVAPAADTMYEYGATDIINSPFNSNGASAGPLVGRAMGHVYGNAPIQVLAEKRFILVPLNDQKSANATTGLVFAPNNGSTVQYFSYAFQFKKGIDCAYKDGQDVAGSVMTRLAVAAGSNDGNATITLYTTIWFTDK